MRALAFAIWFVMTIGWLIAVPAGLFGALSSAEYTLADGIFITVFFLVAPLVLAVGWSLLLQRRLPVRNQIRTAVKLAIALAVFVVLAWLFGVTIES